MIGKRKRFDKTLHDTNDPKSRDIVKKFYLKEYNITLKDGVSKYGIDLISEKGDFQIECEHRLVWKNEEFPYSEVNVPERKAKFFKEGKADYIILSCDYSHIGVIKANDIQKYMADEYLKESPNKHVFSGEYFYKVPSTAFTWLKL